MSDEAGGDSNIFDKTFDTTLDLHVVLGMCGHVWACVGPIWAPKKGTCTLKSQIRALTRGGGPDVGDLKSPVSAIPPLYAAIRGGRAGLDHWTTLFLF